MEAFVDKECWSTIIYKQNALVSGNGATGKLFVNSSVPHQDPLVRGVDPDRDPDPSIIIPWIILVCELNCVKKLIFYWHLEGVTIITGSGSRIRIRIRIRRSVAWIRGSESTPKCHGSGTLLYTESSPPRANPYPDHPKKRNFWRTSGSGIGSTKYRAKNFTDYTHWKSWTSCVNNLPFHLYCHNKCLLRHFLHNPSLEDFVCLGGGERGGGYFIPSYCIISKVDK
jgi:hypothetical protein